jgi:hypothetical protein
MCWMLLHKPKDAVPYFQFNPEDSSSSSSSKSSSSGGSGGAGAGVSRDGSSRYGLSALQVAVEAEHSKGFLSPADELARLVTVASPHVEAFVGAATLLEDLADAHKAPDEALKMLMSQGSKQLQGQQQQQQQAQHDEHVEVALADLLRLQTSSAECAVGRDASMDLGVSGDSTPAELYTAKEWVNGAVKIWEHVGRVPYSVRDVAAALLITAWVMAARFGCAAIGCLLTYEITSQVLYLVGAAGSQTAGHVDPASAVTFAWFLQTCELSPSELQQLLQQPLATWLFISACVFAGEVLTDKLLDALYACGAVTSLKASAAKRSERRKRDQIWKELITGLQLSSERMQGVAAAMGEHAVLVQQYAGRGVWVPAGWLHWVYNDQPCFKVAFEVCPYKSAAACCYMQRRIRCAFKNTGDAYIKVRTLLFEAIGRWCSKAPAKK